MTNTHGLAITSDRGEIYLYNAHRRDKSFIFPGASTPTYVCIPTLFV